MTETVRLCPASDIPEGEIRQAALPDGSLIALYNVDGQIFATADCCTHGEASLSAEGTLLGRTVECSFHFGTFDVTTGEPTGMPCEVPLRTYPVKLIDGIVHVEI
jgi:p-cumate 2,3-dioxygenase ferredoxin subunit